MPAPGRPSTSPRRTARRWSCSADSSPVAYSTTGCRRIRRRRHAPPRRRSPSRGSIPDTRLPAEEHQCAGTSRRPGHDHLADAHGDPLDRLARHRAQRSRQGHARDRRPPCAQSRGRPDARASRPGTPTPRTRGSAPPTPRRPRRRTGTRGGSRCAPRPSPRPPCDAVTRSSRGSPGAYASTGVFSASGSMVRPASGDRSTTTVCPGW